MTVTEWRKWVDKDPLWKHPHSEEEKRDAETIMAMIEFFARRSDHPYAFVDDVSALCESMADAIFETETERN